VRDTESQVSEDRSEQDGPGLPDVAASAWLAERVAQVPDAGVVWYAFGGELSENPALVFAVDLATGSVYDANAGTSRLFTADGIVRPDEQGLIDPGAPPERPISSFPPIGCSHHVPGMVFLTANLEPRRVAEVRERGDTIEVDLIAIAPFDASAPSVTHRFDRDGTWLGATWMGAEYAGEAAPVAGLPGTLQPVRSMPGVTEVTGGFWPEASLADPAVLATLGQRSTEFVRVRQDVVVAQLPQGTPRNPDLTVAGSGEMTIPGGSGTLTTALVIAGVVIAAIGVVAWVRGRS